MRADAPFGLTEPIAELVLHVAGEIAEAALAEEAEDLGPLLLLVERAEHREAGPGRRRRPSGTHKQGGRG